MMSDLLRWLCLLVLLCVPTLADNYEFLGDYRSHALQGSSLSVQSSNKPLNLKFFEGGIVQVGIGDVSPEVSDESRLRPVPVRLKEEEEHLEVSFADGTARLSKFPLRLTVRRSDGSTVTADDPSFGHGWDGKEVRVWKVLHPEHRFFGLGEKSGDVNKRGNFYTNWNSDIPAYRNDSDPLYCGIPFFTGSVKDKAFGIYFPNSYRSTFNMGAGNKRLYSFGAEDGDLSYYIFLGPTAKDVLASYTQITGRMPLPPKWALGYQQCRWSYFPDYEIRDVAKEFRQRQIPADVLYFDIHYMDAYKVFTWHPQRFPQPAKLLSELKNSGFKVVTIIDPGVKVEKGYQAYEEGVQQNLFLKYLDGDLFEGQVWPGWCHFPDFRKVSTRAWWGKKDAALRATGVSGFWNDMNEPALWGKEMPFVVEGIKGLHNTYALLMAQATYEGLLADDPDLRPFVVTRAGWAGIQKYAAVWTGDNSASYDDLSLSIRTNIGLGLSGVPFVGCDIGGFIGRPDPELYTRWMQAASLSPFMRSHTVYDTPDQEPWSYGEETERRCREAIEDRYRLMPLLYSELHRSHETGVPLYRPLWLEFPEDEETYRRDYQHQFMIGSQLLAAPVLRQGQRFQKVYLPEGRWLERSTGQYHEGKRAVIVEADLDSLPIFYREGSVIVTREVQQYVDQRDLEELILTLTPGVGPEFELILDDGLTFSGPVERWIFEKAGPRELKIRPGRGARSAKIKSLKIHCPGLEASDKMTFNGRKLSQSGSHFILEPAEGTLRW